MLADAVESEGSLALATLIRLRLGKRHFEATAWYEEHAAALTGDVNPDWLDWRNGVIARVELDGRRKSLELRLREVFALPAASWLEDLHLHGDVTPKVARLLSTELPRSVRWLTISAGAVHWSGLELPHVSSLFVRAKPEVALGVLGVRLPALRVLSLTTGEPLSPGQLDRLLESSLVRQVTRLDLDDVIPASRTLDDAGLLRLVAHRPFLENLNALWIDLAGRSLSSDQMTAVKKTLGSRIKRAVKEMRSELAARERFDPFKWREPSVSSR